MADQARAAAHWDGAYAQGDDTRSWYEEHPDMSLRMLDSAGISPADALIDLSWHPRRHYQAWHDRAAFHFLTAEEHRQQYLHTLDTAAAPGAIAVFGCFAPDGPQYCSGLPVARYTAAQLARQADAEWLLISQDREEHVSPAGTVQP